MEQSGFYEKSLRLWDVVLNIGVSSATKPEIIKKIVITNRLAILTFLFILTAFFLAYFFTEVPFVWMKFGIMLFIAPVVILLNYLRLFFISRIFFSFSVPFLLFIVPILYNQILPGNFFWFPSGFLFLSYLPVLLFDINKERTWFIGFFAGFVICSWFVDKWMRFGLQQPVDLSFIDDNYFFYKAPLTIIWIFMALILMREVSMAHRYSEQKEAALQDLREKNIQIEKQSSAISKQLETLRSTQDLLISEKMQLKKLSNRLSANEEVLKKAYLKIKSDQNEIEIQNTKIVDQNRELLSHQKEITKLNANLEMLIEKRTKQLEQQNKALTEFAYMNSHKVRGPLARIMGILYLLQMNDADYDEEIIDLFNKLNQSAVELDLEVRKVNDLFDQQTQT